MIRKLLGWRHSGFSLPMRCASARRIPMAGVEWAEYILRSPVSLEKVRYHAGTGTIIYQSKMHPFRRARGAVGG